MTNNHAHGDVDLEKLHGHAHGRLRYFKAALELCTELGYRAIRDEQIAARAMTSLDELHRAFGSKRDLFVALLESVLRSLEARIPGIVADSGTASEALGRLSNLLSDRLRRHAGLARTLNELYLLRHEDSVIRSVLQRYSDALIEEGTHVVERGIVSGEFSAETNPRNLAWTILTSADGLRVLSSVLAMERRESGRELTEFLLCCLSCGESASETTCPLTGCGAPHGKS